MPTGIHVHKLTNINYEDMTANCAKCGENSSFKLKAGKPRCRGSIADYKARAKGKDYTKGPHGLRAYEAKAIRENSCCELCGTTKNLVIDHCHDSGLLRGVLCTNHNVGLGMFADNTDYLFKAIEYLNNPPGVNFGNSEGQSETRTSISQGS